MGTVGPGRKLGFPHGTDAAASARAGQAGHGGRPMLPTAPACSHGSSSWDTCPPCALAAPGVPGQGHVELASLPSRMTPVSSARLQAATWNLLDAELHPQTPRVSEPQSGSARIRGPHAVPSVATKPSLAQCAVFRGLSGNAIMKLTRARKPAPKGHLSLFILPK